MGIYESFGVTPIINATGSVTRLGGAPMPAEVLEAYRASAAEAVPLEWMQAAASRVIAEHTGTEAGLVTSGAASALTLGAAAILAGDDLGRMEQLPQTDGFPNEFLVAREQRNGYDHAVRAAGVRLVEVGFNELVANAGVRRTETWEFEAAIGPRTAGILYVRSPDSRPRLEELVRMAHRHGLAVLVDAAAEIPPRANLKAISATGADLVTFSGGKAIRGPQSTGILCGRRELIQSAALQLLDMDDHPELWEPPGAWIDRARIPGIPRHGIGRGYKVSKEEIAALLTALQLFVGGAYDSEVALYLPRLQRVQQALVGGSLATRIHESKDGEAFPVLEILLGDEKTAFHACRKLRDGCPAVFVGHSRLPEGKLLVHPLCLADHHIQPLIERLRQVLVAGES